MTFNATTWRQHPQAVTRFLYLDQPQAIFAGRAASDVNYPLTEFVYGSTSGSASAVEIGMLVLFGSTAGADDLGRGWIRKLPDTGSSTLYVNRSPFGTHDGESNIAVNSYFTVLDTYPAYARHPYIDPLTNEVFKDFDLDYTTYGRHLPPVVNIDAGVCGVFFDDGSGYASVTIDATTSFAPTPGDTITAWAMSVADGTLVSGSLTSNFAVVKFPVGSPVSRRWITVQATTSAGQINRRHYLIIVAPADGTGLLTQFEISGHTLLPKGTQITFQLRVDIPLTTYIDSLIGCYVEKETFGTTHGSMGGPTGKEHIKFSGWLQKNPNTIKTDSTGIHKDTKLDFLDTLGRLELLPSFTQLVERRSGASTWQQMVAPDINQYLSMLWLMHSTAPFVCDFHVSPVGTSYPFTTLGSDAGNLYAQIDKRARAIQHLLVCDPWGRVYVRGNPQRMITAAQAADPAYAGIPERNETVIVTMGEGDTGDPQWTEERPPRQHWLRGGAIQAGTADAANPGRIVPMLNIAPGSAPGQGVSEAQDDESLAINQTEINAVVGHAYAQANLPIIDPVFPLLHFNGAENFAPSLLSWVEFPNSRLTSRRKRYFGTTRFLPTKIEISHNIEAGTKAVKMTVQEEAIGLPAETEPIPVDPSIPVDSAFTIPEQVFPKPIQPPAPPTLFLKKNQVKIAAFNDDGYVYYSTNFGAGAATHWSRLAYSGVPPYPRMVLADPFSPAFQGTGSAINVYVARSQHNASSGTGPNVGELYYINDLFGTPTVPWDRGMGDVGEAWRLSFDIGFAYPYVVFCQGDVVNLWDSAAWHDFFTPTYSSVAGIGDMGHGSYLSNHRRKAYFEGGYAQRHLLGGVGMYAYCSNPGLLDAASVIIAPPADGPNLFNYFYALGDLHIPYNANPDDNIAYYGSTGVPNWPADKSAYPYDWKQEFDFTQDPFTDIFEPIQSSPVSAVYVPGVGWQKGSATCGGFTPVCGALTELHMIGASGNVAFLYPWLRSYWTARIDMEVTTAASDPIHDTNVWAHLTVPGQTTNPWIWANVDKYVLDPEIPNVGTVTRTYTGYPYDSSASSSGDVYFGVIIEGDSGQVTISKITYYGYGVNPFLVLGRYLSTMKRLLIRTLDGVTQQDISPKYSGESFGPWKTKQISSSLKNRQLMAAALGNADQSLAGIWTTTNGGTTWRNLIPPGSPGSRYERAVLSYDGKNQIFLLGTNGQIAISKDWVHVQSQVGDLLTNYPSAGEFLSIIGTAP